PISTASAEEITVPNRIAAIPKIGGSACGRQICVVSRLPEFAPIAGQARTIRKAPIATITTSTSAPDPAASVRNIRSPRPPPVPVTTGGRAGSGGDAAPGPGADPLIGGA